MKLKTTLSLLCIALALPVWGVSAGDVNVALHKPVTASSQQSGHPASNVTDGIISRRSSWKSGTDARPPHQLEVNLQRYYDIGRVVIHTGIPEAERTEQEKDRAPGFWSMKNFRLQYWDDANWTDLPDTERTENRLDEIAFSFSPRLTTFRLRLISTDGEPIVINELEVYGSEKANMPAPVLQDAPPAPVRGESSRRIEVTVRPGVTGTCMKYVAYNQGYYMPGSNVSGWLEYAQVNSLRVWTSLSDYVPDEAVDREDTPATLAAFEALKGELRRQPEENRFLRWQSILERCRRPQFSTNSMVLEYALKELKRLHIDVVLQINSTDFDGTWANKWKQWQRFYALAFYAARTGDVTMFAMHNEPNHRHAGPMKIPQYVEALKIVSDAVHCAVQDVNRLYGKQLRSRFVSPVTAGSNANWWAEVIRSLRTDYRGLPSDRDLIDIFSTHSYNLPAAGYATKVSDIRKIITDSHPLHRPLPIVYTETGRWMNAYLIDKPETMDSPSLFTEWAGEYTNNTLNGGYGMWAFKFANTTSKTYPRGIKSGHHYIWQGRRIAEDAFRNVALGKKVVDRTASGTVAGAGRPARSASRPVLVKTITDGDKSDASLWTSADTDGEKCLEIDLGKDYALGGAAVYTGSAYGVYTGPDRVKNFRLQYLTSSGWKDIEETVEQNARYTRSFYLFQAPITTSRVRFLATDKGSIRVREIKLFDAASVRDIPVSYDVSGIQRTGQVVRLFAKGFRDERPLLETVKSVADNEVDALTSYSPAEGRYYFWLVQRKTVADTVTLDLRSLRLPVGARVFAEEVSADAYGEVVWSEEVPADGRLSFQLPAQSVMLLTLPACGAAASACRVAAETLPLVTETLPPVAEMLPPVAEMPSPVVETLSPVAETLPPVADATVRGGIHSRKNFGRAPALEVAMDASRPEENRVSYLKFDLSALDSVNAALLRIHGSASTGTPYRFHVYALDSCDWQEISLNWENAPNLDRRQARIVQVGGTAHIAGEMAFGKEPSYRLLDVTPLVRKRKGKEITFVLIRELRHPGDEADKGRRCRVGAKEGGEEAGLVVW